MITMRTVKCNVACIRCIQCYSIQWVNIGCCASTYAFI